MHCGANAGARDGRPRHVLLSRTPSWLSSFVRSGATGRLSVGFGVPARARNGGALARLARRSRAQAPGPRHLRSPERLPARHAGASGEPRRRAASGDRVPSVAAGLASNSSSTRRSCAARVIALNWGSSACCSRIGAKASSANDVLAARPVRGSIEPLFSPRLDIRPFPASIFRRSTSS